MLGIGDDVGKRGQECKYNSCVKKVISLVLCKKKNYKSNITIIVGLNKGESKRRDRSLV